MKKNTTKEVVTEYYNGISRKSGWHDIIADDMNFIGGGQFLIGKQAYIDTTEKFLKLVKGVKIKTLIIEGQKVAAIIDYTLHSPQGNITSCEVAEILSVKDDKINSSDIFFDTAAFRDFLAKG
jgi:ketosteroid isomerase-like protein